MFGVSLTLVFFGLAWIYLATAVVLGGVFLAKAWNLRRSGAIEKFGGLFRYSLLYLFGLFTAIIIDRMV